MLHTFAFHFRKALARISNAMHCVINDKKKENANVPNTSRKNLVPTLTRQLPKTKALPLGLITLGLCQSSGQQINCVNFVLMSFAQKQIWRISSVAATLETCTCCCDGFRGRYPRGDRSMFWVEQLCFSQSPNKSESKTEELKRKSNGDAALVDMKDKNGKEDEPIVKKVKLADTGMLQILY